MAKDTTHFIITVDTETYFINGKLPPFGTNIYGDLPDGPLGVTRMMEICDQFGTKATFFVDIYMHHHYGEKEVAELCQKIDQGGHDVQLHAHTSWIPGCNDGLIMAYPLEKQAEIISDGKTLIRKWIGRSPVAFRAGAYGANINTLRALEMNGFTIDSSYFPLHKNCELSQQLNHQFGNRIFKVGGIFEIPVTTYWILNTPFLKKNSKIDINACSISELNNIIPKLVRSDIKYVILFLHSFSFLRWEKDYSHVKPNYIALHRFETLLSNLAQMDQVSFCTMREAVPFLKGENGNHSDFIPQLTPMYVLPRFFNRFTR